MNIWIPQVHVNKKNGVHREHRHTHGQVHGSKRFPVPRVGAANAERVSAHLLQLLHDLRSEYAIGIGLRVI